MGLSEAWICQYHQSRLQIPKARTHMLTKEPGLFDNNVDSSIINLYKQDNIIYIEFYKYKFIIRALYIEFY